MEDFVVAGLPVYGHDRVRFAAEVALVRGQERGLERLEQHLEWDVALFGDELQDVDEFFVGCDFCHGFFRSTFVALSGPRADRILNLPI